MPQSTQEDSSDYHQHIKYCLLGCNAVQSDKAHRCFEAYDAASSRSNTTNLETSKEQEASSSTLKMEAVHSSKSFVNGYRLDGVRGQGIVTFIVTAVRTANLTS
jgi:hypothetical protein